MFEKRKIEEISRSMVSNVHLPPYLSLGSEE
jgi:hypothetical protein